MTLRSSQQEPLIVEEYDDQIEQEQLDATTRKP